MSRIDVCSMCRYWQEAKEDTGECRRRPPTVHIVNISSLTSQGARPVPMAAFPMTAATSWCGEFEAHESDEGPRAA